jgi:ElaB/YqjD/DUF883 family membrane-anchored ribosome-binding protein
MTIDTDIENGKAHHFDAVLAQADRVKDDTAALASSVSRLLEAQIREKPVQSLLIGVAIGWLAGKLL